MVGIMRHIRTIAIILSIAVCRFATGQYLKSDTPQIINHSNYSTHIESSNYFLDNDTVWSKLYTIKNTSNDTLWIMFDPKSDRSDHEFIKDLFFFQKLWWNKVIQYTFRRECILDDRCILWFFQTSSSQGIFQYNDWGRFNNRYRPTNQQDPDYPAIFHIW